MLEKVTTIKARATTTDLLKKIAAMRGRRETQEQVILELIERYLKEENGK